MSWRSARWRSAFREAAVIGLGVLAALAGQAWWQGRQDRERERDYLRQLLVDTRENEARLDRAIRDDSVSRLELTRLATALYVPGAPPSPDSLLALFTAPAFSSSEFQPIAGTYAPLLATGDLRLVRTDSLRSRIVAYAATLDYERASLGFYQQQAFGDPGRLARAVPFFQLMFLGRGGAVRPADVDVPRLRADPELRSALFALQAANSNRLTHLRRLREATRRLRRALEAERPAGVPEPAPAPAAANAAR